MTEENLPPGGKPKGVLARAFERIVARRKAMTLHERDENKARMEAQIRELRTRGDRVSINPSSARITHLATGPVPGFPLVRKS
jgi:hypothetical protein